MRENASRVPLRNESCTAGRYFSLLLPKNYLRLSVLNLSVRLLTDYAPLYEYPLRARASRRRPTTLGINENSVTARLV